MVWDVVARTREGKQGGGSPLGGVCCGLYRMAGEALLRKRRWNSGPKRAQRAGLRRGPGAPRLGGPGSVRGRAAGGTRDGLEGGGAAFVRP